MTDHDPAAIEIVEQHGSFLLVRSGALFAVLEKRAGQVYPVKPGHRDGVAMTPEGMASLINSGSPLAEEEARQLFADLCERGDRLAQRLW